MYCTRVVTARKNLNLIIQLALRAGLSHHNTKSLLAKAHPNSYVKSVLPVADPDDDDVLPDIEQLTVSAAKSYLEILQLIAEQTGGNHAYVRNLVFHCRGPKLLRTLFEIKSDPARFTELRPAVARELFSRLDEIAETFELPWDEVTRRLAAAHGLKLIGTLFGSPEIELDPPRTLKEILSELPKEKPQLRPYQRQIVKSFGKAAASRSLMHVIALPTGGGKTRTANECVHRFLNQHEDNRVLWLAPSWVLLEQAAINMAHCFKRTDELRYAGNNQRFLGLERFRRRDKKGRIAYSTLHSWYAGGKRVFSHDPERLMVVCDESHWGLDSKMLRKVFRSYFGKALMLGLSATPKESGKTSILKPRYSFADLVHRGYLVPPVIFHIETGITWNPIINPVSKLLLPQCLAELGDNEERNRLVVETVVERLPQFQKLLLFACNREHADTLEREFSARNVSCAAYHAGMHRDVRVQRMKDFKSGGVKLLISVNMAIHGIDIPEIDCIVMARPTESAVLCAQMVGRGARTAPGKEMFHILEFTDNTTNIDLVGPEVIYPSAPVVPRGPGEPRPIVPTHNEPGTVLFRQLTGLPGVEGLPYTVDHTFGVEIELTAIPGAHGEVVPNRGNPHWYRIARSLIECLQGACVDTSEQATAYHRGDKTRWHVEQDTSCGWEIISPPLRNQQGFDDLHRVCQALSAMVEGSRELMIDYSCGLHITLSTKLNDSEKLAAFLRRVQRIEAGLYTLVKPSRLFRTDRHGYDTDCNYHYCSPLRSAPIDDPDFFDPAEADRCSSVNVVKALQSDYNLIEVRMHHGTLDYREIIPWISLWMHIFNRSRCEWSGDGECGEVFPYGDCCVTEQQAEQEEILALMDQENIAIDNRLKSALLDKRKAMRDFWECALPQRVESWEEAGWYE